MKLPLPVLMRLSFRMPAMRDVPEGIRESRIMSLQFLREGLGRHWHAATHGCGNGAAAIDEMIARIEVRRGGRLSWQDRASLMEMYAPRVYSGTPCVNYLKRLPAKRPCRWCGSVVWYRESDRFSLIHGWPHPGVHCNSRDCRRMSWLADKPQSKGGIELTPSQRASLQYSAWDTQRAINYLNLVAKEIKRARKQNPSDLRRCSSHGSANHR